MIFTKLLLKLSERNSGGFRYILMSVHKSVLTQAVANNGFPFEIKRNTTSPFVTMSEDELLGKLSAAREHSAQGKQMEAKAVISDMRSKYGL